MSNGQHRISDLTTFLKIIAVIVLCSLLISSEARKIKLVHRSRKKCEKMKQRHVAKPPELGGYYLWYGDTERIFETPQGENVNLNCNDLEYVNLEQDNLNSPNITMRWTKYQEDVNAVHENLHPFGCKKRPLLMNSRLHIRNLTASDSGYYSCQVFRDDVTEIVAHKTFVVMVVNQDGYSPPVPKYPTYWADDLDSLVQVKHINSTLTETLICDYTIRGKSLVQVRWRLNGTDIGEGVEIEPQGPGRYTCDVFNSYGGFQRSFIVNDLRNEFVERQLIQISIATFSVLVLAGLGAVFLLFWNKMKQKRKTHPIVVWRESNMFIPTSDHDQEGDHESEDEKSTPALPWAANQIEDLGTYVPFNDFAAFSEQDLELVRKLEINRNRLTCDTDKESEAMLGSGFFGTVYKGLLKSDNGPDVPVAVKVLKDDFRGPDLHYFIEEAATLIKSSGHENVISVVGTCILDILARKNQHRLLLTPILVMELADGGDLRSHLIRYKSFKSDDRVSSSSQEDEMISELVSFAHQVSLGMEHLCTKQILHRDLAARNVLLSKNNVVKIGDFGLSKHIAQKGYYRVCSRWEKPAKWTSPEALKFHKYTVASDVWSFGVLVWEIFTLGEEPYPQMAPKDLYEELQHGLRLPKPDIASETLYQAMLSCWKWNPANRSEFNSLTMLFSPEGEIMQSYQETSHGSGVRELNVCEIFTSSSNDDSESVVTSSGGTTSQDYKQINPDAELLGIAPDIMEEIKTDDQRSDIVSHYDTLDGAIDNAEFSNVMPCLDKVLEVPISVTPQLKLIRSQNKNFHNTVAQPKPIDLISSANDCLMFENQSYMNLRQEPVQMSRDSDGQASPLTPTSPLFLTPGAYAESRDYCFYGEDFKSINKGRGFAF